MLAPLSAEAVGESGDLFEFLAAYYRNRFSRTVQMIRAASEPAIVVCAGVCVLALELGVVKPLADLIDGVMGRGMEGRYEGDADACGRAEFRAAAGKGAGAAGVPFNGHAVYDCHCADVAHGADGDGVEPAQGGTALRRGARNGGGWRRRCWRSRPGENRKAGRGF